MSHIDYHMPITLGIIVRDESRIIQRCLDRVKDHITGWVIIDTGSTDNTKALVRESLEGIPGKILDRPWVDFGFNRSELVVEAQHYVLDTLGEGLNTGYLLLLDADHIFHGDLSGIGEAPGYLIELTGDLQGYKMPYLVGADIPWKYLGRTHEYICADGFDGQYDNIDSCTLEHRGDGGTRHEKFERDLKLLEEDYESDPNNERTVYYLAQTLQGMGETERATELFRRRSQLGGFDQEAFWAAFQVGECTGRIEDYVTAWFMRPSRWEPIQRAMKLLNEQRNYTAVLALAKAATREATDDHLFVERWVEEYGLAFELCLALWWTGDIAMAKSGWEDILKVPTLSDGYRQLCIANLAHC